MTTESGRAEVTVLNAIPDERLGGPQRRVLQVAERLKGNGINTIVVTPKGEAAFATLLDDARIPNYQLSTLRRLPSPSNPWGVMWWLGSFIPGIIALRRLIRTNRVDVVHLNGSLNIQVALAARLSGARLLWHLNDIRSPLLFKPVTFPLLRLLPHKVVAASEAARERHFGTGNRAGKISILYPPVDTSRFRPDDTRAAQHKRELGIPLDEKVVGIVGNLNPVKGHEYFVRAARLVKQESPGIRFLVVGKRLDTQEEHWRHLERLISDMKLEEDIILTGHRTDINELINIMDIFVLSSVLEAAPIVLLEAMACGRPVVATRIGGVPELVADGETGIIVPARDPAALSQAILWLLNSPEEARAMGLRGRERAISKFDLAICANRHEEVYRSVLQ